MRFSGLEALKSFWVEHKMSPSSVVEFIAKSHIKQGSFLSCLLSLHWQKRILVKSYFLQLPSHKTERCNKNSFSWWCWGSEHGGVKNTNRFFLPWYGSWDAVSRDSYLVMIKVLTSLGFLCVSPFRQKLAGPRLITVIKLLKKKDE